MSVCPFDLFGIGTDLPQVDRVRPCIKSATLEEVYVCIRKPRTKVFAGPVDDGCTLRKLFEILILIYLSNLSVNNQYGIPGQYLFLLHVDDIGVFDQQLSRELLEKEQGGGQEDETHGFCFFWNLFEHCILIFLWRLGILVLGIYLKAYYCIHSW